MANINCAACGSSVDEASAYFSEAGQVCGTCHSDTELGDAASYRAASEVGASSLQHGGVVGDGLLDSTLQHTRSHTDDEGRTVTWSFGVDAGPLTMIIKIITMIYSRLTKR